MKTRLSIFTGFLFLSLFTFGQTKVNLVVFSEDGDKFYAYVNGIKQNETAGSNVKVTDVTPNISLRVEFEDKALPQLKQNMALEPGFEHTAKIKRDMKKQLKLRYFGSVPLNESNTASVPTVAYHTADDANTNQATTTNNANTTYTTTSTTTQINSNTAATPTGSAININVDGINMNMNVNGMNMNNGANTTYSSTSTTVTSSSSTISPKEHHSHHANNQTELQASPTTAAGCKNATSQANFDAMKKSIASKPFSDTKMNTAKIAAKNSCLSVSQVKEICKLFSMDDDKLVYAKFAYDYCVDKANFYQVSEVFSFSTTTDELNKFLETH